MLDANNLKTQQKCRRVVRTLKEEKKPLKSVYKHCDQCFVCKPAK